MNKLADTNNQRGANSAKTGKLFNGFQGQRHSISFSIGSCMSLILMVLLSASVGIGHAASVKDTKQKSTPRTVKDYHKKKPSSTFRPTTHTNQTMTNMDGRHPIKILYFKKKPAPGTLGASAGIGSTTSGVYNYPTTATIQKGDVITLEWKIKACNATVSKITYSGVPTDPGTGMLSHGCRLYTGQDTAAPSRKRTYRLIVEGRTDGNTRVRVQKTYTVDVRGPIIDILKPEINQNTLNVSLSARNKGRADLERGPIKVKYTVEAPTRDGSMPRITGTFTTPEISINQGTQVDLGSFSLAEFRERLMEFDQCHILTELFDASGSVIKYEGHIHRWEPKTFAINNIWTPVLSSKSSYDIRLNNFGGGVHPLVQNDCRIAINLMGGDFSHTFGLEPYVKHILLAIAPSPIPVRVPVAVYANHITTSQSGPIDFLSVRNGKLVIHLEFPNSGSTELKLGIHNYGRHDEFRDDPIADVELSPFSVDILITPQLSNGRISYSSIEVQPEGVSGTLVGRLDDTLNSLVKDYLNNILQELIVNQLTGILGSDEMRASFENGITDALNDEMPGITKILDINGSGDTITITYR